MKKLISKFGYWLYRITGGELQPAATPLPEPVERRKITGADLYQIIRDKFPDVEYIKTTTARTNRPMRSINKALGFQPTKTCIVFQWALPDLERRLDEILIGEKEQ